MEQELMNFIISHENKQVWFLTAGGILSGSLVVADENLKTIDLAGVDYQRAIQLPGNGTILTDQIIAWGDAETIS